MIQILSYLILIFAVVNLVRMSALLVGSNLYEIRMHRLRKGLNDITHRPYISVVIPAYNEGISVQRSLDSLIAQTYDPALFEIIVVNDGSKDDTAEVVQQFIDEHSDHDIRLINQTNNGKAAALNNGMKHFAQGELVMCLDADSALAPDALEHVWPYFLNPQVKALSANVKILPIDGIFNFVQQVEYLVCYQMKRAQAMYNIEYIIGGVGSTFRRSFLKEVGYYDTDTITEDIDLTMKILEHGNREHRVMYGSDVIAYTESVHNIGDLVKQRFRWKWGRCQTFLKHRMMFFNMDKKFTKLFTCFALPFAIYGDFAFLLEPLLVMYVLSLAIVYADSATLISAMAVITAYITFNILSENTLNNREKMLYIFWSPVLYVLFYIVSFAEYIALLKAALKLPTLQASIATNECHWEHVTRLES